MNQNPLFSLSIEELLHNKIGDGFGNDIVATSKISDYINLFSFPLRVDALVFFVCQKGTVNLTINLNHWEVMPNTYVISLPENILGVDSCSDDLEGYIVLISMDYLRRISIDLKDVLPYYVYVRNKPCFKMPAASAQETTQYYSLLEQALQNKTGNRKKTIIKGLVTATVSRIADDLDEFALKTITLKTKSKEYYFMAFMDLLLQHYRQEHNVGFYAEKLSLSPKYLSALMKEISDLSVTEWINEYIVIEAKTLLRSSDMNISQIADYLQFPNPSFFSKYFRQHTGITPKEYRRG